MKREVLKEQRNEDGSYTRVEKITQTPEDGFVSNREHRASWEIPDHDVGMFGRGRFKGHRTTITYWRTHTKKTRILFYIAYLLVSMVFVAIFVGILSAQKTPDDINEAKLRLVGVIVFFIYCLVKSFMIFRKQDQEQMKKHKKDK